MSQSLERVECLLVFALLHEPSRRLGAEEDQDGEWDGGDECGSELESPCDSSDVLDDCVGTVCQPSYWSVLGETYANPRKIPKAVHNCHPMTKAPRMLAGASSAAYIGTVAAKSQQNPVNHVVDSPLAPIPIPSTNRAAARPSQE